MTNDSKIPPDRESSDELERPDDADLYLRGLQQTTELTKIVTAVLNEMRADDTRSAAFERAEATLVEQAGDLMRDVRKAFIEAKRETAYSRRGLRTPGSLIAQAQERLELLQRLADDAVTAGRKRIESGEPLTAEERSQIRSAASLAQFVVECATLGQEGDQHEGEEAELIPERKSSNELPFGMAMRIDTNITALDLLDKAIDGFDEAAATLEMADRARYTSALVLLVAIRRALLQAHDAYAVERFIDAGMNGEEPSLPGLVGYFARIHKVGPFDPANLSDAQKQVLPDLATVLAIRTRQHRVYEEDPLVESAKLVADQVKDEWDKRTYRTIPPSGPCFTRAQWARRMRSLTQKSVELDEEEAVYLGASPDPAVRHVVGVLNGLKTAGAIPELRDLLVRYSDEDEHRRRCDAAVLKVREYLATAPKPDPEAIIRRILLAFGYESRKAQSLFESLDVAEKRRAKKGSDK